MKSPIILYIKRDQITLNFGQKYQERISLQSLDDLPNLFKRSQQHFQHAPWRILLADDLIYSLTLPLPPRVKDKEAYIVGQLQAEIPEELTRDDWGFALTQSGGSEQAVAFVPVPAFWHSIRDFITSNNIQIEAITTESLASKKDTDPLTGAAKTSVDTQILRTLLPHNSTSKNRTNNLVIMIVIGVFVLLVALNIITGK